MVQLLVTGGSRLQAEVQAALEGASSSRRGSAPVDVQALRAGSVQNPDESDPCAVGVTVPGLRALAAKLHAEVRGCLLVLCGEVCMALAPVYCMPCC